MDSLTNRKWYNDYISQYKLFVKNYFDYNSLLQSYYQFNLERSKINWQINDTTGDTYFQNKTFIEYKDYPIVYLGDNWTLDFTFGGIKNLFGSQQTQIGICSEYNIIPQLGDIIILNDRQLVIKSFERDQLFYLYKCSVEEVTPSKEFYDTQNIISSDNLENNPFDNSVKQFLDIYLTKDNNGQIITSNNVSPFNKWEE